MRRLGRFSSAAALLAVALGVAAPARAETETGEGHDDEAPTIELPAVPRLAAPSFVPDAPTKAFPRWVHRRRPALIAAGAATFGATYAAAVFLGLAIVASGAAEPCSDCGAHGAAAVVPIAGPLLYWWKTPEDVRGSPVWVSIWSGAQAVGAGTLIAGLVGHDVMEWRPRDLGATLCIVPAVAPRQGAVSLAVTW